MLRRVEMFRDSGVFWHVHHNRLFEYCWSKKERLEHIDIWKPECEKETRKRLLKKVVSEFPLAIVRALKAQKRAYKQYLKDSYHNTQILVDANVELDRQIAKHRVFVEALHNQECPNCPWDGKTIFPKEDKIF
jgi:hypothetical protein